MKYRISNPLLPFLTLLAFFLAWRFCFLPPPGFAQSNLTPCLPLQCPSLEICPMPSMNAGSNFTCSPTAEVPYLCADSNACLQSKYIVRLTSPSSSNFYLQYEELSVVLKFRIVSPQAGGKSFIDRRATLACNDPLWNAPDALTIEGDSIVFRLDNYYATEQCDNATDPIQFIGAQANLFAVYVNVYPGETVELACDYLSYQSGGAENYICVSEYPSNYSFFPCTADTAKITESLPVFPLQASENQALLLNLSQPSPGQLPCQVDVVLRNTDQSLSFDIDGLDFTAVIDLYQPMDQITVTPASGITNFAPLGADNKVIVVPDGNRRYIHLHLKDQFYLGPLGTKTLFHIQVDGPAMSSKKDSIAVSLDSDKGRVSTDRGCSKLRLSTGTEVCTYGEFDHCDGAADDIYFKIMPMSGNSCTDQLVSVRLLSHSNKSSISLYHLAFDLEFTFSPGVSIDPDLLLDWDCPANNSGCYGIDFCPGTLVDSNMVSLCWSVDSTQPFQILTDHELRIRFPYVGRGCIQGVKIRRLEIGLVDTYAHPICILDTTLLQNFPSCPPQQNISGTIETEAGLCVEPVLVHIKEKDNAPPQFTATTTTLCARENGPDSDFVTPHYLVCLNQNYAKYEVTPEKDGDDLNGVSTFDLVLINKHILGVQPLGSPYKMLAADVNKSKTISPSDLVEIRKLILGIDTAFSNTNSWRFVDKNFNFPNPLNPFQTLPPDTVLVNFNDSTLAVPDFVAIKVGDVNGNAIANDDSWRANPDVHIGWPAAAAAARAGDVLTLPVYYTGAEALEAIQFGLKFDPAVLTLLGPSAGEIGSYNSQCFGLTKAGQGQVRTLWFADPFDPFQGNLQPGALLFYLTFRLQQTLNAAGLPLDVDDAVLPARAWTPAGREHRVCAAADTERHDAAGAQPLPDGLQVTCFPNPSSGLATFRVTAGQATSLRLALFGPFGNRLWVRDIRVEAGEQDFPAPESAVLPAGVYVWKCYAAGRKTSGHWIKL